MFDNKQQRPNIYPNNEKKTEMRQSSPMITKLFSSSGPATLSSENTNEKGQ